MRFLTTFGVWTKWKGKKKLSYAKFVNIDWLVIGAYQNDD